MRNILLKNSLFLLVVVSAIAWFVLAYFNNLDLSKMQDFFGLIPKVVTVDLFVMGVFAKWGWKLKIFRNWLVPFPDLNGTWLGSIHSDWVNPNTGEKPNAIPVMLTISQSFFHVSCKMITSEMESNSYSEGFIIDAERQIKEIAYSYNSKSRLSLSERSTPHDGTAVFKIIENPVLKLVGRYWTERPTKGEIILEFHKSTILEELPDSIGNHPVTEPENQRKKPLSRRYSTLICSI